MQWCITYKNLITKIQIQLSEHKKLWQNELSNQKLFSFAYNGAETIFVKAI